MDSGQIISRLTISGMTLEKMLISFTGEQAQWQPAPDKWSALFIVNHLYDEERLDFRARLDLTLHSPQKNWLPIDPVGWVQAHNYSEQNFTESVNKFLAERAESLVWLDKLHEPAWNHIHQHPQIGPISAGDLFTSWLTHDYLHIRQLVNLHIQYMEFLADPYSIRYASP